jgi:nitrogen-specific signal transduction histidine kinase
MAGELGASRRRLEHSRWSCERKHQEVEGRRRYVETILDRIATGVVSSMPRAHPHVESAASRLLGFGADVTGLPALAVLGAAELKPLAALLDLPITQIARPQEVAVTRHGREIHLSVVTTRLLGPDGGHEGLVMVFDDISPLVRAQRVAAWREVARRLAHEIKNPLTPIQLCAERLQRHFARAPEPPRALVEECTATIVGEVESLKSLVDEFSQFARMPAPRAVPTDLHIVLDEALGLYRGLLPEVELRRQFRRGAATRIVDPEQIRGWCEPRGQCRGRRWRAAGRSRSRRPTSRPNALVRVVVADDGPGIRWPSATSSFWPYYSTKLRGSGLGLAIVRRIVAEHGGSIDVADNEPHGHAVLDRAAGITHGLRAHRRRRAGASQRPRRRAARRTLRRDAVGERRSVPRAAGRAGRTTSSCSTSGCPAWTASPRSRGMRERSRRAGRDHLRPRQRRVGGARDQDGRVRLRREAAVAREDRAGRAQRAAAARLEAENRRCGAQSTRSTRWSARATHGSCASRSRWRRRPTAAC